MRLSSFFIANVCEDETFCSLYAILLRQNLPFCIQIHTFSTIATMMTVRYELKWVADFLYYVDTCRTKREKKGTIFYNKNRAHTTAYAHKK